MNAKPRWLTVVDALSLILFVVAAAMVLFYVPTERMMGEVQRVFYFHVATAWVGMLGFCAAGLTGIAYLRSADQKWDLVSLAAVEISLVFFFAAIVQGSIWARPSWGTWWTWDSRLTTAAIVEMVYLAYLLLRQGIEDPDRRARFGAIYTIAGFVSVPITFISIRLLRTIHPVLIASGESAGGMMNMTSEMVQTMIVSVVAFSFIFISLMARRVHLGRLAEQVEQARLQMAQ